MWGGTGHGPNCCHISIYLTWLGVLVGECLFKLQGVAPEVAKGKEASLHGRDLGRQVGRCEEQVGERDRLTGVCVSACTHSIHNKIL